jgi:TP53 regulating kinase-like protein
MKDYINDGFTDYEKESAMHQAMSVATAIGSIIAKMHNIHVIHGDLTTSNFILRGSAHVNNKSSPCLFLIDFGLAFTGCTNPEEKAVDLYVLERAFISTHPGSDDLLAEIIRTYKRVCSSSDSVLQRLFNVRQRGRKRECFG